MRDALSPDIPSFLFILLYVSTYLFAFMFLYIYSPILYTFFSAVSTRLLAPLQSFCDRRYFTAVYGAENKIYHPFTNPRQAPSLFPVQTRAIPGPSRRCPSAPPLPPPAPSRRRRGRPGTGSPARGSPALFPALFPAAAGSGDVPAGLCGPGQCRGHK